VNPELDQVGSAQRAIELVAEYLPRFDEHLSVLVRVVCDLDRRQSTPDARDKELAAARDELRRLQDARCERQSSLDEALRERDQLRAAAADALARIRAAEEKAKAAEARADQHIHQAKQDGEKSVQNYLADIRPRLGRILIDIDDQSQDEGANPRSETEALLWQRLRDLKQFLRDRGVLLD
jgi:chromosome segregation ATPase